MNILRTPRLSALIITSISFLFAIVLVGTLYGLPKVVQAQRPPVDEPPAVSGLLLSGYAWSSNIGWISMSNCTTPTNCTGQGYGVKVEPATGSTRKVTGYAWSSNIGWISFNSDATEGCPDGNCQAKMEWPSGVTAGEVKFTGWARACSVLKSQRCDTSQGMTDDIENGGWDGFIALYQFSGVPEFGVRLDIGTGDFGGEAWGSDIVGWVDFSKVRLIGDECTPDEPCWCALYPTADGCTPLPCTPDEPCWCEDPANENDPRCDNNCTVVLSPCWCADPANSGHPQYPRCSGGGGVDTDLCDNIPGEQTQLPDGSQQSGVNCVCPAGKVLKKNTSGVYQCVKPSYSEL